MQLDGVFLDMYGTLTTGDRSAVESTCALVIRDTGVRLTAQELSVIWGERFFAAMDRSNDGAFERLVAIEARTLRETMSEYGMVVDPEPYAQRLVDYWRDPPLQPEARRFLDSFRTPVCIVSNADSADLREALERRGLRVAGAICSEDARSYKPHPAIFARALEVTGWRRDRVIHVGDSLHSDVGGARAAGLRAGWVNRAHRIHDVGTGRPDYEFEDLMGLKALVES